MKSKFNFPCKLISLLCVAVCILAFAVGCETTEGTVSTINGKSAEEVYADAKEFIAACDSYTLKGKITEVLTYQGQHETYSMDQLQIYDKGNVYCKLDSKDQVFASVCSEYWGTDTTIYEIIPAQNTKMRINMSTAEFLESQGLKGYTDNLLMDFENGFFKKAAFYKNDDGKYEIRSDIDVKKYSDMMTNSSLGSLFSSLGPDAIKKLTYTVIVDKDGKFCGVNIDGTIETQEGISLKVSSKSTFDDGKANIPELPADADTWVDNTDLFRH